MVPHPLQHALPAEGLMSWAAADPHHLLEGVCLQGVRAISGVAAEG